MDESDRNKKANAAVEIHLPTDGIPAAMLQERERILRAYEIAVNDRRRVMDRVRCAGGNLGFEDAEEASYTAVSAVRLDQQMAGLLGVAITWLADASRAGCLPAARAQELRSPIDARLGILTARVARMRRLADMAREMDL